MHLAETGTATLVWAAAVLVRGAAAGAFFRSRLTKGVPDFSTEACELDTWTPGLRSKEQEKRGSGVIVLGAQVAGMRTSTFQGWYTAILMLESG